MPRRRKKRRSSPRRRMGGIKRKETDKIMRGVGAVAALVGVAFANKKLSEMATPPNPYLIGAIEIGVGWFGPDLVGNSPLIEGLGIGLMGAGGVAMLQEAGVISGIENVVNGWGSSLNGYNNSKVINGLGDVPEIIAQAAAGEKKNSPGNANSRYVDSFGISQGMMNGYGKPRYDEYN